LCSPLLPLPLVSEPNSINHELIVLKGNYVNDSIQISRLGDVLNTYLCKYINTVNRRQRTELLIILLSTEGDGSLVQTFPIYSERRRGLSKVIRTNDSSSLCVGDDNSTCYYRGGPDKMRPRVGLTWGKPVQVTDVIFRGVQQ
jgi:hypothetical protein